MCFRDTEEATEVNQRAKCHVGIKAFTSVKQRLLTLLSGLAFLILFLIVQLSLGKLPEESYSKINGWFTYF